MTIGLLLDRNVINLLNRKHVLLEVDFVVPQFEVFKGPHYWLILGFLAEREGHMENKLGDVIDHVDTGDWISTFTLDVEEGTSNNRKRLRYLAGPTLAFVDLLHEVWYGFVVVVLSLKVFGFGLTLDVVTNEEIIIELQVLLNQLEPALLHQVPDSCPTEGILQ